ncbi:MAG: Sensor protein QseC [Candidatus Erwinia impunctatus]|nr:Sensor protein QseC [Culicoides impunctatus]
MNGLSLRLRLMVGFLVLMLICWGSASLGAWWQTRQGINTLFDTQQMLFAKRLALLNPDTLSQTVTTLPASKKMLRHHRGELDDDALAFAIFTLDGKMLINDGDNGKSLLFEYQRDGFTNAKIDDDNDLWRLVWLTTPDQRYRIVVGQEWDYREDMTRDIMQTNLLPWLIALPVMIILLFWLVTHELAPLRRVTRQLVTRAPDDASPIQDKHVPPEVRPLLDGLNMLFRNVSEMLIRERRFTSDAAHELRSPLAALKVQSEVAQLAHDDDQLRHQALGYLNEGIERASRLVDQLLTLSRLENGGEIKRHRVEMREILQQSIIDHYHDAQQAGIEMALDADTVPVVLQGDALLLSLMMRNLIDNAIRYSLPAGRITLTLAPGKITVEDQGPGVSAEALSRLGERFYRPPGQHKTGSGLGLSIVNQIARFHQIQVSFRNPPAGGFCVTLTW